jgi:3-dehydroquinate synthase
MLKLETPNLHEIMLDRVIAYGHTWSPLHELVPETPLRHGHAISIDMAYSATLAHIRGLLSSEEYNRLLNLFSRAGLSMDHPQFDAPLLEKATAAILKTRDGKLRAAVPVNPMGDCVFLNDVSHDEMVAALKEHKKIMKFYPRQGAGIEAFVDSSDTGYTVNGASVENGHAQHIPLNGVENSKLHASGPEGIDGLQQDSSSDDDYVLGSSNTNGHQDKGILSDLNEKANGLRNQSSKAVTVESQ